MSDNKKIKSKHTKNYLENKNISINLEHFKTLHSLHRRKKCYNHFQKTKTVLINDQNKSSNADKTNSEKATEKLKTTKIKHT